MSLLDTLKKNLTPEQFTAVQDALGDDFDDDMVPRSRLNKVIRQRNEARQQVQTLLNNGAGTDDDDDDGNGAGSGANSKSKGKQLTQADIDAAVQAEQQKHKDEIASMHKRYAAVAKLQASNFVDPDLVLSAGLIDLSKVTLDDNGAVTGGLDDQISSLAQNKPYLVNSNGGGQRGTGKDGGGADFGAVTSKEEFMKLSTEKQIEFKKANPEVFKSFLAN